MRYGDSDLERKKKKQRRKSGGEGGEGKRKKERGESKVKKKEREKAGERKEIGEFYLYSFIEDAYNEGKEVEGKREI